MMDAGFFGARGAGRISFEEEVEYAEVDDASSCS